jgi:anti-sigma factor RsiW
VLTCYLTRRRLDAYLDGALDEGAAKSAAVHLQSCSRCQREADQLRRLRNLLRRTLNPLAEPEWTGFWPGIVRGIEDARRAPSPVAAQRVWWRPRLAMGGAVAAVLLAAVTVWQMLPGGHVPGEGSVIVSSANTEHPGARVMVYSTPERDVTVVWVVGLEE